MATKTLYNSPTTNPFAFLQEEGQVDAQTGAKGVATKKDDASAVLSPAQKAERRAQANAEKVKEQEAAKQKAEADRALAALVGPLDDFVTQKGPKKSERERNEKKLKSREEFEAAGGKQYHHDGPRKDGYEKRPYAGPPKDGKKQYDRRDGGSGQHFNEKKDRDGLIKKREGKEGGYQGQQGGQRRGREFDKHSAGKTPNKPEDKRHGEGAGNWGSPLDAAVVEGAGWGDSTATPTPKVADGAAGWGDEGEPKSAPVHDEEKKSFGGEDADTTPKEKREAQPSWDDEGFGKMTLKEFQDKVAAEKAAELAKAVGSVQPRARDLKDVDLSKFVEKDAFDDEKYSKKSKKETKKPVASARPGEKQVSLTDVFNVGRPRGAPQGDRPPRGDRPQGERQQRDGDRPQRDGDRPPRGDKPQGERQQRDGDRPPRGDKPQGERQQRDGDKAPRSGGQQRANNRGGDAYAQTHKVPSNKQFPELSAAVSK